VAFACLGLLLADAAGASAATRFAAPGGIGAAPACTEAEPCSLFVAASESSPQPPPAGTEIVLLPGTYTGSSNDLGPDHTISLPEQVTVHGAAGKERPLISNLSGSLLNAFTALTVRRGDVVSDLKINSPSTFGILITAGTVDDVVVSDFGIGDFACGTGGDAVLRDSACLTTSSLGIAVTASTATVGSGPVLRNVTAISTGPNSFGLSFRYDGSAGTVDAKDVIAQGTGKDVRAVGAGAGGSATIKLENSDYATFEAKSERGGVASVTEPGAGGNTTAPPLLAADHVHQLAGSPTIDKGVLDAQSGATDVDEEERKAGIAPDIGADELVLNPTTTAVQCAPAEVLADEAVTCSVKVKDTAQQNPTGAVDLHSDHRGFQPAPCMLEPVAGQTDEAQCELVFTPTEAALHEIAATYRGDGAHNSSSNSTSVTVNLRPSATSLLCSPSSIAFGGALTCTATVSDPGANPPLPGGMVKLTSDGPGTFAGAGACTLAPFGQGKSSCNLAYIPSAVGDHRITASYQGDAVNAASQDSATVRIIATMVGVLPPGHAAPDTILKRKPRRRTAGRRARFAFVSDQPDSSFECKVDRRAFKPCRSPRKLRSLKRGRHSFSVRAVSAAGIADPTPATYRWRVSG
jgi:hypothetical protein